MLEYNYTLFTDSSILVFVLSGLKIKFIKSTIFCYKTVFVSYITQPSVYGLQTGVISLSITCKLSKQICSR